jgi:hypothetical protein
MRVRFRIDTVVTYDHTDTKSIGKADLNLHPVNAKGTTDLIAFPLLWSISVRANAHLVTVLPAMVPEQVSIRRSAMVKATHPEK